MKLGWKEVRLGEVLKSRRDYPDELKVKDGIIPIVAKVGFKEGLLELRNDGQTNTSLILIKPGDLLVSGINLYQGAVALNYSEKEVAATIHYSSYFSQGELADLRYFWYYFRSQSFKEILRMLPSGIKTEIKASRLLDLTIPLPPLAEQQQIVTKLDAVKTKLVQIERLRAQQDKDVKALLFAHYTRLVENAEWLPMREVAPITRRPVEIDPEQSYPELGIRSFGKGTFHKPAVNGLDVGTKKLFQVKANDLMFSNVFAWEGAIAVATSDDDGRVGSHRFISCVPDHDKALPGFLCYYLLTSKGMEAINAASPGGAGRNKTLGLEKLERITVPVPSLASQAEFLALRTKLTQMQQLHARSAVQLEQLMPSLLAQAFGE